MSAETAKATAITPPVASKNVIVLAASATARRLKIPSQFRNSWLTVEADGEKTGFLLGGDSVTASLTGVTTLSGEDIGSFAGTECERVPDGTAKHVDLSQVDTGADGKGDLYLSHIQATATGYVTIKFSSGRLKV
ncbi:MAG: hypothetical protein RLP09_09565 [Sandaracinaceae bacterium]